MDSAYVRHSGASGRLSSSPDLQPTKTQPQRPQHEGPRGACSVNLTMDRHEAAATRRHSEYRPAHVGPQFGVPAEEDDYFGAHVGHPDVDLVPQSPAQRHSNSGGSSPRPPTVPTNSNPAYPNPPGIGSPYGSWNTAMPGRPRGGSVGNAGLDPQNHADVAATTTSSDTLLSDREQRRAQRPPGPARTPSNTYDPPRRPPQFISFRSASQMAVTGKRPSRRDPNAQYRAQEKAYVQRVRQGISSDWTPFNNGHSPADPDAESEPEEESPASERQLSSDPFDFEDHLLDEDDARPTFEDLQDPRIRERLEWHSMLASVLKGDVVRQEKQRLIGTAEQNNLENIFNDIWFGLKARRYGRTIAMQKRIVEHGRASIPKMVEDIIAFEIKGQSEAGKPALQQVEDVVAKIDKCECLYSSARELETAHPRTASEDYRSSCDAVIAWHNTTLLINSQLTVLQKWVGNEDLDLSKKSDDSSVPVELPAEGSFLDRLLKEDVLKSLQGDESMLDGVGEVIKKAKSTLIDNAEGFAKRHLPPYIEELLTLINFPTRLIEEVIRIRLSYAKKVKDPGQQSSILVDQMLRQFQILMKVAVEIKQRYVEIASPEPGWELPPCVDEHFDTVIVDALKFYFRLLNWKLTVNKNTFKEAEILEQEWDFSNEIGRQLEGGDIEVAEQFRYASYHVVVLKSMLTFQCAL